MGESWIVSNLNAALSTWNDKLAEIWSLLTESPQTFKGGQVWGVMTGIHGALQAIGYGLLVLFFAVGVMKTCGSFVEVKKPEHALKLFIRFALAKGAVTYGLELMLAVFSIVQGMVSTIITQSGSSGMSSVTLPQELMFDRLGRIESETPFVLEWFVQHGIEMWSTHEGQQKIETHGDKLMNYIRFWQAAGESEKTSIRTRDRIRQIVSSGHYTGGFVCYGYQLVDQGRRNKRDKPVMDLVINEEEATWVRELFYKVIQEGTSGYALAEMLNNRGLRTRAGAKFQSSNIIRIIRHEGYTGYIITKNARSEYIKELQIIDRETFDKANDIINRRKAKSEQERKIAHTSQNPTLLAGIVYCAHCGAKMSGFMHTDRYKLADGSIREKVQPKYNCFQRGQRNKGGRDCDGQALYLAERVDAIVLKIVEEVFEQIRDTPYSQVAENRIRQESNLQKTKRAAAEKKIKAAQHALERFEGEILKCLDGTSNFTEDMIAKQIRRYQQELDDAKAEYAELQNARLNEAAEIRKLRTYYDDFKGWAEEFDTAPLEMKRMILSHLIDRVEVGRKYQVIVKFNMKYRQFLECTAETYNTEIGA